MANTGLTIFNQNSTESHKRQIMNRIKILNQTADVTRSNYQPTPYCIKNPTYCDSALISGAETELYLVFIFLYADWTEYGGNKAKNEIINRIKQNKNPGYFIYQKNRSHIIVEKRDYFESDELTKYLFLPYLDIPICEKLFLNAGRVSTIYSNINRYPGLFAYGTRAITNALDTNVRRVSPGIPEVSYNKPTKNDVVMTYSAFPLFLHPTSWRYGVIWYANMLNSSVSQTSLGAIDTIKMTGK
jgi:hypothetical protein